MPVNNEFTLQIENHPGTLGKICQAFADKGLNVLAFQAFQAPGNDQVRIVLDNPMAAQKVLDSERVKYSQTEVAQVKLANRSGELARAGTQLGKANININYAYCGIEPGSGLPLVIFGVKDAGQAAQVLDRIAAAA